MKLLSILALCGALYGQATVGGTSKVGGTTTFGTGALPNWNPITLSTSARFQPSSTSLTGLPQINGGDASGYQSGAVLTIGGHPWMLWNPWQNGQGNKSFKPQGVMLGYQIDSGQPFACTTNCLVADGGGWNYFDINSITFSCPNGTCTGNTARGYCGDGAIDSNGMYYMAPALANTHPVLVQLNYAGGDFTNSANWAGFELPLISAQGGADAYIGSKYGWCGNAFDGRYIYYAPTAGFGGGTSNDNVLRFDTTQTFAITNFQHTSLSTIYGSNDASGFNNVSYDGFQNLYFPPSDNNTHNIMAVFNTKAGNFTTTGWTFFDLRTLGTVGHPSVTGNAALSNVQASQITGNYFVWDPTGTNEWMYMIPYGINQCGITTVPCTNSVYLQSVVLRTLVGHCGSPVSGSQTCASGWTPVDITASSSTWEAFDLAGLTTSAQWATSGFATPPLIATTPPERGQLSIGSFQLGWVTTAFANARVGMTADHGSFYVEQDTSKSLTDITSWYVFQRPTTQGDGCMGGWYYQPNHTYYASCPGLYVFAMTGAGL